MYPSPQNIPKLIATQNPSKEQWEGDREGKNSKTKSTVNQDSDLRELISLLL
jgi:hypothetical protein